MFCAVSTAEVTNYQLNDRTIITVSRSNNSHMFMESGVQVIEGVREACCRFSRPDYTSQTVKIHHVSYS
jgi:hypothetical protein